MITSTKNPRVKHIARLRRKGDRDATGRFLVEGARELGRAIRAGVELDQLVYSPALLLPEGEPIIAEADMRGVEIIEVHETVFRAVSYRDGPDGLLAVARTFETRIDQLAVGPDALVLVVAQIEKPGNLGAMLRSAAAAEVSAMVVADPVTDVFNPNVVRASLGTLFTVPLGTGSATEVIGWLRDRNLRVLAATPEGAVPYWEAPLAEGSAIVIGAESLGLPAVWLEAADHRIVVPMADRPGVDSLNAAATAAILLFDAVRQRSAASQA